MRKIYAGITLMALCPNFALAQANLPDPMSAAPSNSNFYYENKGQIADENGNLHPEIRYYTEHTYPEVYLADDKISFVATKLADTNIVGDMDSIGRIDLQFLCNKQAKSQSAEKPSAFVPCGIIQAFELSADHLNYYLPQCPNGITDVPGYARIVYENAFPNIDVHFYSNAVSTKLYFVVKPGGNPSDIDLLFTGQDSIGNINNGLAMYLGEWKLQFPQAIAYQVNSSNNTTVLGWLPTWVHNGNGEVTLGPVGSYNTSEDLVISIGGPIQQPTGGNNLEWATFYGADGVQCCSHIAANENAVMYHVIGERGGIFKSHPGALGYSTQNHGDMDWYISKFNANDSRAWATYYGGSNIERPASIIETFKGDPAKGAVWVGGLSQSYDVDLGQASGFQQPANAGILNQSNIVDGLLASFNKASGVLISGTYFGGAGSNDAIAAMSADPIDPVLYICGRTYYQTNFANNCSAQTTGSFPLCAGPGNYFFQGAKYDPNDREGFVASFVLNADENKIQSLQWSTLFGGNGSEYINTILKIHDQAEDALYIGGATSSTNNTGNYPSPITTHNNVYFPLTNPGGNAFFQTSTTIGRPQLFLAKFDSEFQLAWCTLFGRNIDGFMDLAMNSKHQLYALADNAYTMYGSTSYSSQPNNQGEIPLYTNGTSFFYATKVNNPQLLVCRFNDDLSLGWSTFLPGNELISYYGLDIDRTVAFGIDADDRIYTGTGLTTDYTGYIPVISIPGFYNQSTNASQSITDFNKTDNYIMAFDNQEQLKWATYFGGALSSTVFDNNNNSFDGITGLALSGNHDLYLTGETFCKNSPYTLCPPGAYCDQTYNPSMDAFIARFNISDITTGISNIQATTGEGLFLYPNPSEGLVLLEYQNPGNGHTAIMQVTDLPGKVVSRAMLNVKPGKNNFRLNLHQLSPGIYFLEINCSKAKSVVKFVKK